MASEFETSVNQEPYQMKKGYFSRFRFGRKSVQNAETSDKKLASTAKDLDTSTTTDDADSPTPLDNLEVNQSHLVSAKMKTVRFPVKDAMKKVPVRSRKELLQPPTAREAAFGGPPRYDWIDIETAAAIKVQSVFRRNRTMKELENQGITTAAIRNRSRRRQARMGPQNISGSADIPNLLACCGVGLAFGDATEEDFQASRQHEKEEYMERKKQKEAKEEELRIHFQKLAAKKKAARLVDVEEIVEVVEE